jgi:hypothetical protein
MKYEMGDIVRHKFRGMNGLWEVSGITNNPVYQYFITNNECDSEVHVKEDELIFVCSVRVRKDLD